MVLGLPFGNLFHVQRCGLTFFQRRVLEEFEISSCDHVMSLSSSVPVSHQREFILDEGTYSYRTKGQVPYIGLQCRVALDTQMTGENVF
jgi:hypothetical protein